MADTIQAEKPTGVDIQRGAEMLWSIEDQIAALETNVRTLKGTATLFHEELGRICGALGIDMPVNPRSGGAGK
jgi:hypothetical protein